MRFFIWKSVRTFRVFGCLYMARMFGTYRHSGWNGEFSYARYTWRGKDWIIPTGPVDEQEEEDLDPRTPQYGVAP